MTIRTCRPPGTLADVGMYELAAAMTQRGR
jgi:hypothetical protein